MKTEFQTFLASLTNEELGIQHDDDKLLAELGIDITKIKAEPKKSPARSYADAVKFLSNSAGVK